MFFFEVEKDIYEQLNLKNPARFKTGCFRKNLFYDVVFQDTSSDPETDLALYASKWLGDDWESQPIVCLPNSWESLVIFLNYAEDSSLRNSLLSNS